jgi:signal transduction histidine kinase
MDPSSPDNPPDAHSSLRRAERLLACFQTALGHELPNQLVAVQGLVVLLQQEEGERLTPEGRDGLRRLAAVLRRAHDLVRELADVGRAVRQQPASGRAVLGETTREVIAEVKQLSPAQPIEYHITDPGNPLPIADDSLRQVLGCLVRQAARRAGDRPLRVEVRARVSDAGTAVWVADDGPALTPAERQHLFEPFAGRSAEGGPVLGPFLCSLLVDAWGGALDVESTPPRGNRITITLPRQP